MTAYLAIENKKLDSSVYETEREEVLQTWHTGRGVDFKKGLLRHRNMADTKKFSVALANAETQGQTILQPRAGVALLREHIQLLSDLSPYFAVVPTTVYPYHRPNL